MLIKRLILSSVIFTTCLTLTAQTPKYYLQGKPVFKNGGYPFPQPTIGGLNSTQFYPMDINNDGVNDLLCFDRNDNKILPFLRSADSTFTYAPQYEAYFPKGFYYYKTADLNSDGKLDIFTLDETSNLIIHRNITASGDSFTRFSDLGPQFYRNQYVPPFPILYNGFSLSKTDMPEISDIDGDGDLDILTYDGFYTIYVLYSDVRADYNWSTDTFEFQKMDVCFGYFNDFNASITLGDCPYKDKLKPRHSGGAACMMFDADEDGDKELVLSNIGQKPLWILTNGKKEYNHDYDTLVKWDSIFPKNTVRATTYEFPGAYLFDADGDSIQDLITSPNGFSDVKETNQMWYYKNFGKNNKPDFRYVRNNFIADQGPDLGASSVPAFLDADADGDKDLFVASNGDFGLTAGIADRIAFYENKGTKKLPEFELKTGDYINFSNQKRSDLNISFGDVDGDGDEDLLTGDRFGYVRWYRNNAGPGNPVNFVLADTNLVNANSAPGESNAAPTVFNYNNDTLPDLLVGYYHGGVILYVNNGTKSKPQYVRQSGYAWGMRANEWIANSSPPGFSSYGYAVPRVTDLDHDGKKEILVGTAYGAVRLYKPNGRPVTDSLSADDSWLWQRSLTDSMIPDMGSKIAPCAADLTGDTIPEIFIGNSRGGLITATTSFTRISGVNSPKYTAADFILYPNPASGQIFINRTLATEDWSISITDLQGRVIRETQLLRNELSIGVNLGDLPDGMYLASVKGYGSGAVKKFLVQGN